MKAVYIKEFGGAENLEIREVENPPAPKKKKVLVSVKASALNRADLLQRMGKYPAPAGFPARILGLEFAGEVSETSENVTKFNVGDRVFGITAGAAQAEFLLTDESLLAKIPDNLTFVEAAGVPEVFITAHDAIFTNGELKKGETLLIHAVGSGVGLAALQLGKAKGAKVIGTSRTAEKLTKANEFGLDAAIVMSDLINLNENEMAKIFAELIEHFTVGKGVDVILDLVGASYFAANVESLKTKGRVIFVGTPGGAKTELNISRIMAKRAKLIGTVLRSRPTKEKAEATAGFVKDVIPLLASGAVRPVIDHVFKINKIRQAHEYLESNASFGKVVLEF